MIFRPTLVIFLSCVVLCFDPAGSGQAADPVTLEADVCVYGATPSGILAAIAVKRENRTVVLIEPGRWVGGMLGAGLKPLQDCPNFNATGGLTRELLPRLGEKAPALVDGDRRSLDPKAIRGDFLALLNEHGIEVRYDHRIAACEKDGGTIRLARFDLAPFDETGCPVAEVKRKDALIVTAKMFIDASYEGSLMAEAGVPWRVGRESEAEFGEELAGVREPMELAPIDPFLVPGDPASGLLPWVEDDHGKAIGSADDYTQAYNYRYYTTADPAHRVSFGVPADYDPGEFELVGRYVAHLVATTQDEATLRKRLVGIFPGWKNSGEWNYQRESLFSMAPLGVSQDYAAGDAVAQSRVWKAHRDYLRGLHRFMSTDSRVPEAYREEVAGLGLDGRVHPETQGWPHQLYIRVARRLEGRYTVTAADVYNRTTIDDPVALAQYGIDTYPARRIWGRDDSGATWVGIEGKMFVGGAHGPTNVPYAIPYRAITPKREDCTNLLVPVCFSASHLGYASARMEPVFMICGESAGIAAVHALDASCAVQEIDPSRYQAALLAAGQKLSWDPAKDQAPAKTGGEGRQTFARLLEDCDTDRNQTISRGEWEEGKSGWEWLFPKIDRQGDGLIDEGDYEAFQQYKQQHADWSERLKKETIAPVQD